MSENKLVFLWVYFKDLEELKKTDKDHAIKSDRVFYGTAKELKYHAGEPGLWIKFKEVGVLR